MSNLDLEVTMVQADAASKTVASKLYLLARSAYAASYPVVALVFERRVSPPTSHHVPANGQL
jgi:hypothetical protein